MIQIKLKRWDHTRLIRLTAAPLLALLVSICADTSVFAITTNTISVSPNPVCLGQPVTVTVSGGCVAYLEPNPAASVGGIAVSLISNLSGAWTNSCTPTNAGVISVSASDSCSDVFIPTNLYVVQLTSLSVSNATAIEPTNATDYGAVKTTGTNDFVIVQANVTPALSNAQSLVTETGGTAVPGTNSLFQWEVTQTNSAKTAFNVICCTTNLTDNIWIIWSTISILTNGTNPADAPSFVTGGELNELGTVFYTNSNGNTYAAGQICAMASITPAGINRIITNNWDFTQMKITYAFADGVAVPDATHTSWTNDGPGNAFKNIIPDSGDKIYGIDGPLLPAAGQDSAEVYYNFYDFITWNSKICCDTNNYWHWQGRWKINQNPQVTFTDLGTGLATLRTNAFYPPP